MYYICAPYQRKYYIYVIYIYMCYICVIYVLHMCYICVTYVLTCMTDGVSLALRPGREEDVADPNAAVKSCFSNSRFMHASLILSPHFRANSTTPSRKDSISGACAMLPTSSVPRSEGCSSNMCPVVSSNMLLISSLAPVSPDRMIGRRCIIICSTMRCFFSAAAFS